MGATIVKTGGQIFSRLAGEVGNADTSYVYFALNSHGFKQWSIAFRDVVATTITLEFSNSRLSDGDIDRATAAQLEAFKWIDQTDRLGTGVTSITADNDYTNDMHEGWYIGRVKLVTTNATNGVKIDFNGHR